MDTSVVVPQGLSPSATRMRVARERRKAGSIVVQVELPRENIDRLVTGGWLSPSQVADRSALASALLALTRSVPPTSASLGDILGAAIRCRMAV